jgi:hypothetical protein
MKKGEFECELRRRKKNFKIQNSIIKERHIKYIIVNKSVTIHKKIS